MREFTAQDARRTAGALAQVGSQYGTTIAMLTRSEVLHAPARAVAAELEQTPPSMLADISRGKWIPLPSDSPAAERLMSTARDAAHVSSAASALTDVAVRPPHPSLSRYSVTQRNHQDTDAARNAHRAQAAGQHREGPSR